MPPHVKHVFPLGELSAQQRGVVGQAGIVDAHVHAAQVRILPYRLEHGGYLFLFGHVTLDGRQLAGLVAQLLRQRLEIKACMGLCC